MGRLVDPRPSPEIGVLASGSPTPVKDYGERVAKYVPSEIIAVYAAINGSVGIIKVIPAKFHIWIWVVNFLFWWVMTPIYFAIMAKPGQPKRLHMIIGFFAFPVWAYAVIAQTGFFGVDGVGLYDVGLGTIVLCVFSFFSGLFAPKEGDK